MLKPSIKYQQISQLFRWTTDVMSRLVLCYPTIFLVKMIGIERSLNPIFGTSWFLTSIDSGIKSFTKHSRRKKKISVIYPSLHMKALRKQCWKKNYLVGFNLAQSSSYDLLSLLSSFQKIGRNWKECMISMWLIQVSWLIHLFVQPVCASDVFK